MRKNITAVLLLVSAIAFSDNFLPEDRKGDWLQAGYLRFLTEDFTVHKVNDVLVYGATNNGLDSNNNNFHSIIEAIKDTVSDEITMIFFPEGIYKISSSITIENSKKLIIRGEGSDKTKLIFNFNGENHKKCISIKSSEIIGIENLYIEREDSTDFGDNISIRSNNCWISGVESNKAVASHISIYSSENIEIRGCHIHHAWNYGVGGHGYGIILGKDAKRCLIEDNILHHLRHSIILSNGPSSNVFGYNYSTDPFTTETYLGISDWPSDLCLHGHPDTLLNGPDRNLFEGNISAFMHADDAWYDNGSFNTYLRNRATYYGLKIYVESDSQNIIANEVDDSDGSLLDALWNAFNIQSNGNYVMGNTNFDPDPDEYPLPENYSSDLSLYFNPDSIPEFLNLLEYLPPIGVVDSNHMGGGTIPAKQRWEENEILTVLHPEHDFLVKTFDKEKSLNDASIQLDIQNHLYLKIKIRYTLESESKILLSLYSVQGQLIAVLKDCIQKPGRYIINWSKTNKYGKKISPGIYLVRLKSKNLHCIKPVVIM